MVQRGAHTRQSRRGLGVAAALLSAGVTASVALLVAAPAHAEASSSTATLTLTGVVDSNCVISAGGTTVYIAPGGTVDFKAALAGISVNVLGTTIPLDTAHVASFIDTLVIDGDTKHPQSISGTTDYKYGAGSGNHTFTWTASSVQLLPIPLLAPNGITVPLSTNNTNLPAGAKLTWNGTISNSKANTCGISAQLPGVQASAGPVKVSIPPIALPSVTVPSQVTGLIPGLGGPTSTAPTAGPSSKNPLGYTDPGQQVPAGVVPKGGGNGLYGQGGAGGGSGSGGGVNGRNAGLTGADSVRTAGSGASLAGNPTDLSSKQAPAAQIPIVLAILAILSLSLVSAAYARVYLVRRGA